MESLTDTIMKRSSKDKARDPSQPTAAPSWGSAVGLILKDKHEGEGRESWEGRYLQQEKTAEQKKN